VTRRARFTASLVLGVSLFLGRSPVQAFEAG
jgi:hypothetical protein